MKAREVNKRIADLGGRFVRQRGSHRRYTAFSTTVGECHTTVPQHPGDLPRGTLASIERDLAPVFGKGWLR